MRDTTNWGLTVPDSDTDPDDVPTHLGGLADQLDGYLGSQSGTLAERPAAGKPGQLYYVESGTGAGTLYRWTGVDPGASWVQLNGVKAANISTTVEAEPWAAEGTAGDASKGYAAGNHVHPMPPNPVIAHLADENPHPQYALITDLSKYASGYGTSFLLMGA